jgi:hypothetical protein
MDGNHATYPIVIPGCLSVHSSITSAQSRQLIPPGPCCKQRAAPLGTLGTSRSSRSCSPLRAKEAGRTVQVVETSKIHPHQKTKSPQLRGLLAFSARSAGLCRPRDHSHSIVAGGLLETS